jgi:hypothetical protein
MAAKKPAKKYFTVEQANATLPLVRAIVGDISRLAHDLRERQRRMARLRDPGREGALGRDYLEELEQMEADFEADRERLQGYVRELSALGVELKDYFLGLIDFLARRDGRDVYLCWRLGEGDVEHWHELDAGFAGRQKLFADAPRR